MHSTHADTYCLINSVLEFFAKTWIQLINGTSVNNIGIVLENEIRFGGKQSRRRRRMAELRGGMVAVLN